MQRDSGLGHAAASCHRCPPAAATERGPRAAGAPVAGTGRSRRIMWFHYVFSAVENRLVRQLYLTVKSILRLSIT